MVFTLVAVVVVLGLLIGFVTLSVLWTARTVGKNIRDRSIELITAYDELLENRSRELSALDVELEQREAELARKPEAAASTVAPAETAGESALSHPMAFLKTAEQLSTTAYQDVGTGEVYQRVRRTFSTITDDTARQLAAQQKRASENGAGALLRALPFDTVYQLSTLAAEEQLQLLRETIPAEMRSILENYAASVRGFDCIAFYDALRAAAAAEPGPTRIRVAPQDVKRFPAGLDVTIDEDICEGYQVEMDSVLYDYAIRTREIG